MFFIWMRNRLLLKEQYPITVHVPNFDFLTGCHQFKRCKKSKRTLKNPFASCLAEFDSTLKLLRIILRSFSVESNSAKCDAKGFFKVLLLFSHQWYIVPVKFRFGRNQDILAFLSFPLAGGPREWKQFNASWRLISPTHFHTSSDNSGS